MSLTLRKQIRLPATDYVGANIYFVTVCSQDHLPVFANCNRGKIAVGALQYVAGARYFLVHAYCLMPDHAHVLVEAGNPTCDLVKFVHQWKQRTGYLLRADLPRRFWQRRFYDHVLRRAGDCESVAWYIWMNPVRGGLVRLPQEYPLSGSFTVEWPKSCAPSELWVPPWKPAAGSR
jgi:putative transposase